jgi:hypothetical protein
MQGFGYITGGTTHSLGRRNDAGAMMNGRHK